MSCKSFEAIAEENTREFPPACEKGILIFTEAQGQSARYIFNGKEIEVTNVAHNDGLEWLRETGNTAPRKAVPRAMRRLHHCNLR